MAPWTLLVGDQVGAALGNKEWTGAHWERWHTKPSRDDKEEATARERMDEAQARESPPAHAGRLLDSFSPVGVQHNNHNSGPFVEHVACA